MTANDPHIEAEPLLLEIARSLEEFSRIEWDIATLFCQLTGIQEQLGHITIASVVSFEARLAICTNLIADCGPVDLKTAWPALCNDLIKALKKRNQLAHFNIVRRSTPDRRIVAVPYFSLGRVSITGTAKKGMTELTLADVKKRRLHFRELRQCLTWASIQLIPLEEPPAESRALVPNLVRIALEKASQKHGEHQPPRQSSEA